MYKINEFASFFEISTQALKYYEKKGLLSPAKIDPKTNYRYYTPVQFNDLSLILYLKGLGFTINEIISYRKNQFTIDEKISLIEEKIQELEHMKTQLDSIKSNDKYIIYNKVEKEKSIVFKRIMVRLQEDLVKEFADFVGQVIDKRYRIKKPFNYFIVYRDKLEKAIDMNVVLCIEIEKSSDITMLVPKKRFIATIHTGGYNGLINAHNFLFKYAEENNLKTNGWVVEQFLQSYGDNVDPSEYITEVKLELL